MHNSRNIEKFKTVLQIKFKMVQNILYTCRSDMKYYCQSFRDCFDGKKYQGGLQKNL